MFDFGRGPEPALNISWGDVATAYYTTGIPNVETYYQASPLLRGVLATCRQAGWLLRTAPFQALLKAQADMLPEGPREEERARAGMVIVAEASDERGVRVASRLRTPEAYTFTGTAAASVAMRALAGDLEAGFQTPARVFGPDFVLHLEGVSREDLA
jgi:short subunit dehydrogenase-like uncharacterized protein